jgi:isoquinoline 1-oxidoreductase beta subunit
MPQRASAQTPAGASLYDEPATPEINAWIVIAPDDTVTIRIAQTELGQGVWTSNAMMVCEELQCDWKKVRPQYASANRDAREKRQSGRSRFQATARPIRKAVASRRSAIAIRKASRAFPTASIGACGRTPLRRSRTAATTCSSRAQKHASGCCSPQASLWSVPVSELGAKDSVITHKPSGRTTTYGKLADRAAQTPHPHPEQITIKPPDQWTLMGTEQKNLDVPDKVTGKTVYGIDVRLPGMKWACSERRARSTAAT